MTKIIVGPKYCKIEDEDDTDFLRKLDRNLSFRYAGADFMPAVKSGNWDGRVFLLSKKLTFMTGLLDNVKDFYNTNSKSFVIDDVRDTFVSGESFDITDNLNKLNIVPFDYQLSAIDKAIENDRMIFYHATGSGKSLVSALITAKLNKPTIIYVISKELLFQFHTVFSQFFNQPIGIVGAGKFDLQNITIVSIWTLGRALGMKKGSIVVDDELVEEDDELDKTNTEKLLEYLKTVKIHQFDECHVSSAETIQNIYKNINPEKIFGYSGTPWRDDGSDLLIEGVFGRVKDRVSASSLILRGILARPYIKFLYHRGSAHFSDNYQTVYSNNVVNDQLRNNLICHETKKLIEKNYQVLVLYKTIKHGKILFDLFKDQNINCVLLSGKDKDEKRAEVKQDALDNKLDCIIASQIFDVGIDIGTINALVLAGSGKSTSRCLQRIGRCIRNGKNKPMAAIVDIVDDVKFLKKHSKIRKEMYDTEPEFVISWPKNVK